MSRITRTIGAALVITLATLAIVASLVGCTKQHPSGAAAKSAVASAVASASNSALTAEGHAVNTAAQCAVTAGLIKTTSDVTYKLTPKPVITSISVSGHAYRHPGKTTAAFVTCEQGKYAGNWPKIRNCVQASPPAFGHGYFTRLFQLFVDCVGKYAGGK